MLKVKEHAAGKWTDKIDLSAIIDNPYLDTDRGMKFDPAQVYDFEPVSYTHLLPDNLSLLFIFFLSIGRMGEPGG